MRPARTKKMRRPKHYPFLGAAEIRMCARFLLGGKGGTNPEVRRGITAMRDMTLAALKIRRDSLRPDKGILVLPPKRNAND